MRVLLILGPGDACNLMNALTHDSILPMTYCKGFRQQQLPEEFV